MKGQILDYNSMNATGVISGEDGARYEFAGTNWKGDPRSLRPGTQVDFSASDGAATDIYALPSAAGAFDVAEGEKSPLVAGLLGIFLGAFGIHKFYLGYQKEGVIMLAGYLISWPLMLIIIGFIGIIAIPIIGLIEGIIYITKSPAEFQRIYVDNKKPWF